MKKYIIKNGDAHVARNDAVFTLTANGLCQEFRVLETVMQARAILAIYHIIPIDHPIELWETETQRENEDEEYSKRVRLIAASVTL